MKLKRPTLGDLLLIAVLLAAGAILFIKYTRTDMKALERKMFDPHSAEPH